MRILVVTPTLPVPIGGGRTRPFNLIRQLSVRHEISVISFVQPSEAELLSLLEPHCRHVELVPFEGFRSEGKWRNRLQGWRRLLFDRRPDYVSTFPVTSMRLPLRRLLDVETFDIVVFEQLFLAELLDETGHLPVLLVEQNVESDIAREHYAQATNPVHKLRDWLTWRRLLAFERDSVQRFSHCVAVSEHDAVSLRAMSSATRVYVVPNGVDSQSFAARADHRVRDVLLFLGTLSYGPNVDGLLWFCRQVLPKVRETMPNVRLEIVGPDPVPQVVALGELPGVHLTGFVPDVRPKLWSATISVVPLRAGGGTRLKILEALAAGCPVVSTAIGAEGLDLVDGVHLLVADAPEDLARAVVSLLGDDSLRLRLAETGRQAVVQRFDWQQIAISFESACIEALSADSAYRSRQKRISYEHPAYL